MSYEKQNFTSGQVLTAAALNHMEDGIANAGGGASSWNDLTDKPFDVTTEMVEIVPEQSVNGHNSGDGSWYGAAVIANMLLEANKEYTVVINDKKTKITAVDEDGEIFLYGDDFEIVNDSGTEVVENQIAVGWLIANYSNPITLAIYEEQEVVKKLDPKFVDKAVLYAIGTNEDPYLYHDEAFSKKVTKSELFSMNGNVLVYADFSGSGLNYRYYSPTACGYNKEYGIVYLDNGNTELNTSEYVNVGPM